jgi:hypothetical protein
MTVAVVVALVVAAGAFAGAAAIRWRAAGPAAAPSTSQKPPPSNSVGVSGCLVEPCTVLATTTVSGGTQVELIADAGLRSGRLRIGSASTGQVIETQITDLGVTLNAQSLQCISGGPSACLVKGEYEGDIVGEVIVGRSESWALIENRFTSDADYLALANTDGDAAPELVAAQHDCRNLDPDCASRPIFLQVFALNGELAGCSQTFSKLTSFPGYPPAVDMTKVLLKPCK